MSFFSTNTHEIEHQEEDECNHTNDSDDTQVASEHSDSFIISEKESTYSEIFQSLNESFKSCNKTLSQTDVFNE